MTATRVGPNASFLQKAVGVSHEPPRRLPKGEPATLAPGDILWLCQAHYPLRLIERLPGPFFQARPLGGDYPTGGPSGMSSIDTIGSGVGEPVAEASTQPLPVGVAGAGASVFESSLGVADVEVDNEMHSSDV